MPCILRVGQHYGYEVRETLLLLAELWLAARCCNLWPTQEQAEDIDADQSSAAAVEKALAAYLFEAKVQVR